MAFDNSTNQTWLARLRRSLGLFLPLYFPAFLFSFSQSLLVPVLPLYAQTLDSNLAVVGVVLAAETIGMVLADLPSGMILRRIGQKGSMILGLALNGLSTTLIFFTSAIPAMFILRMIAGVGTSLFSVSRHYYLAEMAPPLQRGRISSLFGGFFRMGRMAGPIVGGTVAAVFGYRASFLAFGVVCGIALFIVIKYLPYLEVPKRAQSGSSLSAIRLLGSSMQSQWRIYLPAGVGFLFMQFIRSGPQVIIPLYAANILKFDVQAVGWVMSLSSAIDMLLFYPAGLIMDRWGRKRAIILSSLLIASGLALVPFSTSFATLLMAGMLAGFGNGFGSGAMLTLGADLSPNVGRSEFLGAWTLVGDIGATSGPLSVGGLAQALPLSITAWIVSLAGLAAALIFGLFVAETLKKPQPQPAPPEAG